jgi:RHS repeat-associated protein
LFQAVVGRSLTAPAVAIENRIIGYFLVDRPFHMLNGGSLAAAERACDRGGGGMSWWGPLHVGWPSQSSSPLRQACTRLAVVAVLAAVALLLATSNAVAQPLCTDSWTGPSEGSWQAPSNWSRGSAPSSSDVACIGAGSTVSVTEPGAQAGVLAGEGALVLAGGALEVTNALEPSNIASLTLGWGNLSIAGELAVGSALSSSGGERTASLSGGGRLVVSPGATATIGARCWRLVLNGVTLANQSTLTFGTSTGTDDGAIWMENGAQLQNVGTFNDNSTEPGGCGFGRVPSIDDNGGSSAPGITNTGTFGSSDSEEPVSINVPIANQGTITAHTGSLQLAGGGTASGGTLSGAAGATLALTAGSYSFNEGSWSGAGTIALQGASVSAAGAHATVAHLNVSSGALTLPEGTSTTVASGTLTLSGEPATVDGPGSLVVGSSATGTLGAGRCSRVVLNGVRLVNEGTITTGTSGGADDGSIWMENGAQLQNAGTFNDNSTEPGGCGFGRLPSIYDNHGSSAPSVTNTGTLQSTDSEEPVAINVPITNVGTMSAQVGSLQLAGGGSDSGGAISPASGSSVEFTAGSYTLSGDSWSGAGTIAVTGANVSAANSRATVAHVNVSSGQLTLPEGTTTTLSSGSLTLNGSPATVVGPGHLVVGSSATATFDLGRCSRTVLNGVTIVNEGTITTGTSGGAADGSIWMENGAQLQNAGTFNDNSTEPGGCGFGRLPSIYNNGGGLGVEIVNTGTFQSSDGEEPVPVGVPVDNQGTLRPQAGTLQLVGGGSGSTGAFTSAAGTTLEFTSGSYSLSGASWSGAGTIAVTNASMTAAALKASTANVSISSSTLTIPAGPPTGFTSLSLNQANLSLAGELAIGSALSVRGETTTVSGGGSLTVGAGASATLGARCFRLVLNGVTLANDGTVLMGTSSGTDDGSIWMENGAQLRNAGTFNDNSTEPGGCGFGNRPSIYNAGGSPEPAITNTGTLQSTDSEEPIAIDVPIANQGTIAPQAGRLLLAGGGSSTANAAFLPSAATTLEFTSGTFTFTEPNWSAAGTIAVAGADVTASGLQSSGAHVSLSTGSFTIPAGTTTKVGSLDLAGGTLSLPGQLTVSGSLASGGTTTTIAGAGKLVVGFGAQGAITGGRCFRLVLNGVTLVNDGTTTFGNSTGTDNGSIWMENGAQLQNAGTFNDNSTEPGGCGFGNRPSIYNAGGSPGPAITNTGTLQSTDSEEPVVIDVPTTNQGNVNVNAGTLQLPGNIANGKQVSLAAGTILAVTGNYTQSEGGTLKTAIAGTGKVGTLSVQGSATLAGILDVVAANGFNPELGQSFAVLSTAERSGVFSHLVGSAGSGQEYQARYSLTGVSVAVTNSEGQAPAPVVVSPPTISGANQQQGQTLVLAHGSWKYSPTEYTEQWLRCDSAGANCEHIAGASGQTYVLVRSDVGHTIEVQETAHNAAGDSAPSASAPTNVISALPLRAVAGENVNAVEDAEVVFNASGSTPASEITRYEWEFGDGGSAQGVTVKHAYTTAGTYAAKLTVVRGSERQSATLTVTVTPKPEPAKTATITVQDANKQPLASADVLYISPSGARTEAQSNSSGVAELPELPEGSSVIYAYKSGYRPGTGLISVNSEHVGSTSISLEPGEVASAGLNSHEMTLSEIVEAGINPNEPANQVVYEFEAKIGIEEKQRIELHGYVNGSGELVGAPSGGGFTCSPTGCEKTEGETRVVATPTIIEEHPVIQWLVFSGKAAMVKQFFEVNMIVQNLSTEEPFTLTEGTAKLNLPAGMSLAPTAQSQSLSQTVPRVPPQSSVSTTWIVRGDQAGQYHLSADYNAQLEPFFKPVELQAALAQPLDVWGTNALTPALRVDSNNPERGKPWHVSIGVTNKANIPLYNVAIEVNPTSHEHFIYQPKQRFSQTIAEVPPGQTVYAPALILVPDSRREVKSSLQEINLAGETGSTSGVTQDVPPPTLYGASADAGSSPVHLHWQQVPGAEGYEVFSIPEMDSPFGSSPDLVRQTPGGEAISRLPASADEAYVSGGKFFAVSTIVEGRLVLDHPVVETLEAGEPEVPEKEKEEEYGGGNEAQPHKPHCLHGDPVNCVTGNHVENQTDFLVAGRGPGLHLTRAYNSQQAASETTPGPFGYGWTGPYSAHLVIDGQTGAVAVHQDNGAVTLFAIAEGAYWPVAPLVQARLVKEENGDYVYTPPGHGKLTFNGAGVLVGEADRNGNAVALSYEGGRLTRVTDPAGRKLTLTYNSEGLVETASDPMGHVYKYAYEHGDLASVTYPGEASPRWRFGYDSARQLTTETDGRGHSMITEYDGERRAVKQTDAMGRKRIWAYAATPEGAETNITEPNESVTSERFNSAGLPTSIAHAAGSALAATTKYEYDKYGDLTTVINALGHPTTYTYDADGNRTSETNALDQTTKRSYNSAHEVISTTTPAGATTTTERDEHGNPIVVAHPDPGSVTAVTKYKYDAHGDLESFTDPLGRTHRYEYNEAGDRIAEIDPEGDKRTFTYDGDSNVIATVSARGNVSGALASSFTTKIERDAQEREIKTTNPLGDTTKESYDSAGNPATSRDALSHTTSYTYDADNELITTTEPAGTTTETSYDSLGQEASQTDANKHTTKYVHNLLGQVTEVTDALGRATKREYDAAGELTKLTDAAGRTTSYRYNGAGRLIEVSYSDGHTPTVKYEYDTDGNRVKMLDGTGLTTYAYDQLDRLTEVVDGHADRTAYEYDLDNEQTGITYANGKAVTRAFDNAGRLRTVTDWLGHKTTYTYDADGNLTKGLLPTSTGVQDAYTFNDADQLTKLQIKKGTKVIGGLTYTLEKNGLLKTVTPKEFPGELKTTYVYNADDRLTKFGATSYEYDPAGNPTTFGASTDTYDAADQLQTATGSSYAYNAVGERTEASPSGGTPTSYGYDQAGDLTSVTHAQSGETPAVSDTYGYNGDGLRTSQAVGGQTSYLTWDAAESLPLLLSDGSNSYVYGAGDLPLEQISSAGGVLYFHHDKQGSTRMLTGATGAVEATFNYGAYGALLSSSGSAKTPLGYDGQLTSPDTGLLYLRARTYDPSTGQFLSVDPSSEQTRSRYSFVSEDPVNGTDPSGLCEVNTESLGGFFGSLGEDVNPGSSENCFYQGTKGLLETVGVDPAVIATGAVIAGLGVSVFLDTTVVGAPLGAALGTLAAAASAYQSGQEAGNGEYLASALDGISSLLGGTAGAEHLLEGLSNLAKQVPQLGDLAEKTAPTAKQLAEVFDGLAATSTVATDVLNRLHQVEREEAEGCATP